MNKKQIEGLYQGMIISFFVVNMSNMLDLVTTFIGMKVFVGHFEELNVYLNSIISDNFLYWNYNFWKIAFVLVLSTLIMMSLKLFKRKYDYFSKNKFLKLIYITEFLVVCLMFHVAFLPLVFAVINNVFVLSLLFL